MKKQIVKRPSLTAQRKLNHDFGGTYFPYYTNNISTQYFSVFANSTNRPLVYRRGASIAPQWASLLIRETAQNYDGVESPCKVDLFKNETFSWKPFQNNCTNLHSCYDIAEKVFTFWTDEIHDDVTLGDAICVTCQFHKKTIASTKKSDHIEDNYRFKIDTNQQKQTKKSYDGDIFCELNEDYSVEIIMYPQDVLFLPSEWRASLKPLIESSDAQLNSTRKSMPNRQRVLACTLRAYMEPLKRCGHFSTSEKLTLREHTEEEFFRRNVRKQVRWDEIEKGDRKVF